MAEGGGAGVRQLLVGCLQPASSRLSAKDLAYLAAVSETTSQYQRSRIVRQLGCKQYNILQCYSIKCCKLWGLQQFIPNQSTPFVSCIETSLIRTF